MDYKACFQYLHSLLHQMSALPEEKRQRFLQKLCRVQSRLKNPYLHMALIGDFSTGKSTFINALLQQDLLKTAWQATTAVPTLIYCHDRPGVQVLVETSDGGRYALDQEAQRVQLAQRLQAEVPPEPQDAIAFLSSTNAFAEKLKRIRVRTPGAAGLRHICIIDTPGVNPGAEDARSHVERTREVLQKYADATIILFQSERVYTASFQQFLKENAGRFMDDAVFVITMMDLVEPAEQEEVIAFAKDQLRRAFGFSSPRVFGCCAKAALSGKTDLESRFWAAAFDGLREEVIQYLGQNRTRIIQAQTSALLSQILQELDAEVTASMAAIQRQKRILETHSAAQLKTELDGAYQKFRTDVQRLAKNMQASSEYDQMFDSIYSAASASLDMCTKIYGEDCDSIAGYLKNGFPEDVAAEQRRLTERIDRKFTPIRQAREAYCEKCRTLFQNYQAAICQMEPSAKSSSLNAGAFQMEDIALEGCMDSGLPLIAGAAAAAVLLMPCMAVDALFDCGLTDAAGELLESAAGGVANFFGQFGTLERRRSETLSSIQNALAKAKAEHQAAFHENLKENGRQILADARDMESKFAAAYTRVYQTRQQEYLAKHAHLEQQEAWSREVHRKLTCYLDELKKGVAE